HSLSLRDALPICTNGGVSWYTISGPLKCVNQNLNRLVVDPVVSSNVYAATEAGIYRSTEAETNWALLGTGLGNSLVRDLTINRLSPAEMLAATAGGIYRSTNYGTNWIAFNTGLSNLSVGVLVRDPVTPSTIYAGT